MEIKQIITMNWWRADTRSEVDDADRDLLVEEGQERVKYMMEQGYTSGQLISELDGKEYEGWWSVSIEDVEEEKAETQTNIVDEKIYFDRHGEQLDIEHLMSQEPSGLFHSMQVLGVDEDNGMVFPSDTPSFYAVYWEQKDGTHVWCADFLDSEQAEDFARYIKSKTKWRFLQDQLFIIKARMCQERNQSFRFYETNYHVPAELSGIYWSLAAKMER